MDFGSQSLGSPNPFLAPAPELRMKADRIRSMRQTEHRVLARPLGRSIAETSDADAARQSSLNGSLHEFRCEKRERDRHIDLANAAFFACSDLLDTGDGASNDLFKPATTTGDGCDKSGAGLSANRPRILWQTRKSAR